MNRIQLIGRLGRDPERGQNAKGGFATFSLATHEFWTDRASGEPVEHTEWGPGVVMRTEDDRIVVLFDEVGYKTLGIAAVTENDLLRARPAS